MTKEVIILGRGRSWIRCPKEGEVWAVNVPRSWNRVGTLFVADSIQYVKDSSPDYVEKVNSLKIPIYLQNVEPDIPTSIRYPIEEVVRYFDGVSYFGNTICYMMAYAIMCGYEEINLYGVDQHTTDTYGNQKGSVEHWVGMARGAGIKVNIPRTSDVCRSVGTHQFYGYKIDNINEIKLNGYFYNDKTNGREEQALTPIKANTLGCKGL